MRKTGRSSEDREAKQARFRAWVLFTQSDAARAMYARHAAELKQLFEQWGIDNAIEGANLDEAGHAGRDRGRN
jgi:hypothetical protein